MRMKAGRFRHTIRGYRARYYRMASAAETALPLAARCDETGE